MKQRKGREKNKNLEGTGNEVVIKVSKEIQEHTTAEPYSVTRIVNKIVIHFKYSNIFTKNYQLLSETDCRSLIT